ncbi:MAG: inosine/guanosine kinase [Proteobacteria bacterium]|nr:inosine/guanosine kinase [Pseudomonadota bacterium]MBQ4360151.1 inosine/guanosine kinase [Pseudomonadota bacterium]
MRFPGIRKGKYYFPVTEKKSTLITTTTNKPWYIVGLDEIIVDLEIHNCPQSLLSELGLVLGESVQFSAEEIARLFARVRELGLDVRYAAGGTIANTLCNYTHLSGEPAILLGAIPETIHPKTPAFAYVAQTPKAVNLDYLVPVAGEVGVAVTCFTPDGERSFAVAPGISGNYRAEDIDPEVIRHASVVASSVYCLANHSRPIADATLRMFEIAHEADIPVAFGLGTSALVRRMRDEILDVLKKYVNIAAMNAKEAEALTGFADPLLAGNALLDYVDTVLVTEGAKGLTMCGYTDDSVKRATRDGLHSGAIENYNQYEYSRLLLKKNCNSPVRIFTHIHPYLGGPQKLCNTSGAGDAALAAFLHDVAATRYHAETVPDSKKHAQGLEFLTYSSLSRNAQYSNRVAYEVLRNNSPRLEAPIGNDKENDNE